MIIKRIITDNRILLTMKKLLFIILAVVSCSTMLFTSCDNDKDTDRSDNAGIVNVTLNAASLYDELNLKSDVEFYIRNNDAFIIDSLLIYDANGNLVRKLGVKTGSDMLKNIQVDGLPDGKYTFAVWQTLVQGDDIPWAIYEENKLSTVYIAPEYSGLRAVSAIGYTATAVTVGNGASNVTMSPKAMGAIVDVMIDNLHSDSRYGAVQLVRYDKHNQYYGGFYLDPSRGEDQRWLMTEELDLRCTVQYGNSRGVYFTLCHGDSLNLHLMGIVNDQTAEFILYHGNKANQTLDLGEKVVYYTNLDRVSWQPPFYGSFQDYIMWSHDRNTGKLVTNPLLNWGCSLSDVKEYYEAKQWRRPGNGKLDFWAKEYDCWHYWYFVAPALTEQYLFETEEGENLRYALTYCYDLDGAPVEVAKSSLEGQGYTYKDKYLRQQDNREYERYLSADGKTEALVAVHYDDGEEGDYWIIIYQPAPDTSDL